VPHSRTIRSNWWSSKKVLMSPEASLLTRDYVTRLHGHHEREGYWVEEPAVAGLK